MAIYSRCGAPVKLITARQRTVYIEERPGEIKWHYKEPKPVKRTRRIDAVLVWHVTAEMTGSYPDGSGKIGERLADGREITVNELRADEGWPEIEDACKARAACDCENPEPLSGVALVSMECPVHNDNPWPRE